MESKTYVFGNEGSTSNNGMLGLLAPLLQKQGVDPNVLLAMKGNNGFGGEGGWFMWVIFLFFLMGWGGNGWGGFGNNGRGGLANEINNDYGRGLLMDAIGGNRNALSNLATQLNCTEGQIQSAISALTSQIVGQAVAPINQVLAGLQNEVAGIKCKLPETVTTPYSPFTAVPNCVAYQAGLYGLNAANNAGFWG